MPQHEARALLKRLKKLQPDALAEVYDTYSQSIYAFALRLSGDVELAEECVAETFFRLLKALQNGSGPAEDVRPYLYQIAHNWITDYFRQQPLNPLPLEESWPSQTDAPLELEVDQRQKQARMRAALGRLTPDQRLVISLRFIEGLAQESVAQALGKPLSAVKSLQHRGLQSLRRMLVNDEESSNDGK